MYYNKYFKTITRMSAFLTWPPKRSPVYDVSKEGQEREINSSGKGPIRGSSSWDQQLASLSDHITPAPRLMPEPNKKGAPNFTSESQAWNYNKKKELLTTR